MSKKPKISYRDLGKPTPPIPAPTAPAAEAPAGGTPTSAAAELPPAPLPAAPSMVAVEAPADLMEMMLPPDIAEPPRAEPAAPVERVVPERFRDRARQRIGRADLLIFRVGRELFGIELATVEEAIDCPEVRPLPEMPPAMRGVAMVRDGMVALYSPGALLGVIEEEASTVLVFRGQGRRAALVIDDVDDVFVLDCATLTDAPLAEATDTILVGVARRGRELIGVLDAEALLAACRSETVLENV